MLLGANTLPAGGLDAYVCETWLDACLDFSYVYYTFVTKG